MREHRVGRLQLAALDRVVELRLVRREAGDVLRGEEQLAAVQRFQVALVDVLPTARRRARAAGRRSGCRTAGRRPASAVVGLRRRWGRLAAGVAVGARAAAPAARSAASSEVRTARVWLSFIGSFRAVGGPAWTTECGCSVRLRRIDGRQCRKLRRCRQRRTGADCSVRHPVRQFSRAMPLSRRVNGIRAKPRPRVQAATKPASIACRSAWYDERTSGPEATWVKPSAMP